VNQHPDDDEGPIDSESEAALWEALEALQELGEEDPAEALAMFESLPAEVQELSDFQLTRAGLLRATDDLEEAQELLERLLKEDPEDRITLSTHRDLGGYKWVRRILEKIDPQEKRPYWTRGVAS